MLSEIFHRNVYSSVVENLHDIMRRKLVILCLVFLFSLFSCCTSSSLNRQITVTSLDPLDIPSDQVGNFDVYTESFLIENPTNLTFENIGVDIRLLPTATYCHGLTKSFDYPQFYPREKKTEQISIAEFGSLNCQYNYTYNVYSTSG